MDLPNGGYLKKEPLNLTPAKILEIVNQMQGLDSLIQKNLVKKFGADSDIGKEIAQTDGTKFKPDQSGKITISLSGDRKLHLDLSQSKISSALYGQVEPGKQNAVCLNVATLIEPKLSGEIRGPKDEIIPGTVMNEFNIDTDIVGNRGEVKTGELSLA